MRDRHHRRRALAAACLTVTVAVGCTSAEDATATRTVDDARAEARTAESTAESTTTTTTATPAPDIAASAITAITVQLRSELDAQRRRLDATTDIRDRQDIAGDIRSNLYLTLGDIRATNPTSAHLRGAVSDFTDVAATTIAIFDLYRTAAPDELHEPDHRAVTMAVDRSIAAADALADAADASR